MVASRESIEVVKALATLMILYQFKNDAGYEPVSAKGHPYVNIKPFLQVLRDFKLFISFYTDWCWTMEEEGETPAKPEIDHYAKEFLEHATKAQVEKVVDHLIPLFIERLRRPLKNKEHPSELSHKQQLKLIAAKRRIFTSSYFELDGTRKEGARLNWKSAKKCARTISSLIAAQRRASERAYAPGGRGYEELHKDWDARFANNNNSGH